MNRWFTREAGTKVSIKASLEDDSLDNSESLQKTPEAMTSKIPDRQVTFMPDSSFVASQQPSRELVSMSAKDSTSLPLPNLDKKYELLAQIGIWEMGTIWKVFDSSLNTVLAVKIILQENALDNIEVGFVEQNARKVSELTHSNIGAVYGTEVDSNGSPFVLMDFIEGESLASILAREGKLDSLRAIDIFNQVAEALTYAHTMGVIHGGIDPSKIIISKAETGPDLVHVVDFGITSSLHNKPIFSDASTRTIKLSGNPLYMSPERFLGEEVTEQSDIYSLGCILFEMLTGAPPFKDSSLARLLVRHLNEEPDFSKIPQEMRHLVSNCLAKRSTNRPQNLFDDKQQSQFCSNITLFQIDKLFVFLSGASVLEAVSVIFPWMLNSTQRAMLLLMFLIVTVAIHGSVKLMQEKVSVDSSPIALLEKSLKMTLIILPIQWLALNMFDSQNAFTISIVSITGLFLSMFILKPICIPAQIRFERKLEFLLPVVELAAYSWIALWTFVAVWNLTGTVAVVLTTPVSFVEVLWRSRNEWPFFVAMGFTCSLATTLLIFKDAYRCGSLTQQEFLKTFRRIAKPIGIVFIVSLFLSCLLHFV